MARPRKYPHSVSNRYGKVSVYRTRNRAYTSYKIIWKEGRTRRRETRADEQAALDRANEILQDLEKHAPSRKDATADQWAYYRRCEEMLDGVPLITAVEYFLEHGLKVSTVPEITVTELKKRFVEAKKLAGRSARYVQAIGYHLKALAEAMRKPIAKVTVAELDMYLSGIEDARTRHNHRGTIIAAWKWAQSKGWLPADIKTAADRTETPSVVHKDPGILTPDELTAALRKAESEETLRRIIPYMVLGAFGGIRSAEIGRLTWDDINLEQGTIILSSSITKTRRRRVVHMEDVLVNWLRAHQSTGKIVPVARPHHLLEQVRGAGDWPHNALRHSAVSYLMALHRNAAMVAEQCGHTEAELQASYKAATTAEQALQWFNIQPIWQATPTQQKAECA